MGDKDRISIIVSVYNAEKTISRCMETLITQSYPHIEIILVNDGSTDNSLEICQSYKAIDNRIVVIDKKNGGVSTARNAGIEEATGDYIMFVDSDDWVQQDYCSTMIRHYVKGNLVMCAFEECMNSLDRNETDFEVERTEKLNKSEFLSYREIGIGSPCNKLFERAVIVENNLLFPESLSLGEDLAFVLGYLQAIPGDILYIHKRLYIYQIEVIGSLSKQAPTMHQNKLFYEILDSAVNKLSNNSPSMIELRNKILMQDFEKTMISLSKNKKQSFVEKCKMARVGVNTKAYKECCRSGVNSSNPVYRWLYKQRLAELLMLYLVIRNRR